MPLTVPIPPLRGAALIAALALALIPAGVAGALQDATPSSPPETATTEPPPTDTEPATPELTASEQTIEVDTQPVDEAIDDRLTRILTATGRFTDPQVEVRDGVIFLFGRTKGEANRTWAGDLARKTKGAVAVVNDIVLDEEPLWNLDPALGEVRALGRQLVRSAPLVAIALVVFILTVAVSRFALAVVRRPLRRRVQSELVSNVVEKLLLFVVMLVGIYLFLRISGLTRTAVTLAGGTGLVGLALGFAFRDIAENFLASILISVQRPFRIGDTIEVAGHTGVVQRVTMRGTVLMDFEGNHIQLSNSTVYKSTLKNFSANPKIRIDFGVGIGYDAVISDAQRIALDVLQAHSAVLEDPEPIVLVDQLAASTINLRAYAWIDGNTYSKVKVRSALMRLTAGALAAAGISMPDEAREVLFPQGVPVRMLEAASSPVPPAPPTTRAPARVAVSAEPGTEEVSEGEGDLASEVADIQQQADESRSPEEGPDIMDAEPPEPARGA